MGAITKFIPIVVALLAPLATASSQVNFYYDDNCQNYAGSAEASLDQVVGGPAGSQSMLWVNSNDNCYDTCGPNLLFCKNSECNAWDVASSLGECKHFANGVWAEEVCGCLSCTNECSGTP